MKNFFLILVVSLLLVACDTTTNYHFFLQNNASSTLTVSGVNKYTGVAFTQEILIGEEAEIAQKTHWGQSQSYVEPTSVIDSLLVINTAGDTLLKDYTNAANWSKSLKKKRGNCAQTYHFSVADSDF